MHQSAVTGRRGEVNKRLNECWRIREEEFTHSGQPQFSKTSSNSNQAYSSSSAVRVLKYLVTWLRVAAPKNVPHHKSKQLSSTISHDIASELKRALDSRKVAKVIGDSLFELLGDPSKSVRLCNANDTSLEIGKNIITQTQPEHAFAMVDLTQIAWNWAQWTERFPEISPRFCVAQNSDRMILRVLASLGVGFTCTSKRDLEALSPVLEGVHRKLPERVVDRNPCKPRSYLNQLIQVGVSHITVDSCEELKRFAIAHSKAKKLEVLSQVRIDIDLASIPCSCGKGATICRICCLDQSSMITRSAMLLGIKDVGVAVNLEQCCAFDGEDLGATLNQTLEIVKDVCVGLEQVAGFLKGIHFHGWSFGEPAACSKKITMAVSQHFGTDYRGRLSVDASSYLIAESIHIIAKLQGKRSANNPADPSYAGMQYYIDDGCYGTFNSIVLEKLNVNPVALNRQGEVIKNPFLKASTIWGPTCDGIDCVVKVAALPDLNLGDWLLFQGLGVNAQSSKITNFNGLQSSRPVYCIRR